MAAFKVLILALAIAFSATAEGSTCSSKYRVKVLLDTASHPAGIRRTVNKYNALLGGEDNGSEPGPKDSGRRSINWDAAPLPFDMPFDFFNTVAPRGAIFTAKDNEFRVSNTNNASDIDDRFNTIVGKGAAKQFQRFSLLRLFTPLKKNLVRVSFRVPGTEHRATVRGFGAIFSDVDFWGETTMRFYDYHGCLIADVPVMYKDKGLSFAGVVVFDKCGKKQISAISHVDIKLGTVSFADFKKVRRHRMCSVDLVSMDDLFYAEPVRMN